MKIILTFAVAYFLKENLMARFGLHPVEFQPNI